LFQRPASTTNTIIRTLISQQAHDQAGIHTLTSKAARSLGVAQNAAPITQPTAMRKMNTVDPSKDGLNND